MRGRDKGAETEEGNTGAEPDVLENPAGIRYTDSYGLDIFPGSRIKTGVCKGRGAFIYPL